MLLSFLINYWKFPKIPVGLSGVSIVALVTGVFGQRRAARANQRTNERLDQQHDYLSRRMTENHEENMNKLRELQEQNAQLQEQLKESTRSIKESTTKKFVEFNDALLTWEDITDYFYKIIHFGESVPFEYGITLSHLLLMLFILFLLFSHLSVLYGNYLIEKFDLVNKYPKLHKILEYRMKYQKFYMFYNAIVAITLLLIFIIIDILILIDF